MQFLFGFDSCIMGQVGYIVPRLVIGYVHTHTLKHSKIGEILSRNAEIDKFEGKIVQGFCAVSLQLQYPTTVRNCHAGKIFP